MQFELKYDMDDANGKLVEAPWLEQSTSYE